MSAGDDDRGALRAPGNPAPAPVADALPDGEAAAQEGAAESSSPSVRPPVLASEALRRDLMPATPGRGTLRGLLAVLGAFGAAATVPLATAGSAALPVAGALAILALLGAVPMPYAARAAAVVAIGSAALTVTAADRIDAAGGPVMLVLEVGVIVLASALVFRNWHRASVVARLLVFVGSIVCAGWLWLTRALFELSILDAHWQQWLPRVAPVMLVVILMLALLAFMDARSTGGCGTWASVLLGWYALYEWALLVARSWPIDAAMPMLDGITPAAAASGLAGPLFVVFVSVGLAQLLAVAASGE